MWVWELCRSAGVEGDVAIHPTLQGGAVSCCSYEKGPVVGHEAHDNMILLLRYPGDPPNIIAGTFCLLRITLNHTDLSRPHIFYMATCMPSTLQHNEYMRSIHNRLVSIR